MRGVIRRRDILAHPVVTITCFGWQIFFKTLMAGRDQTFLSLLVQAYVDGPPAVSIPELVDRCIRLELQARSIYQALARCCADRPAVAFFFQRLADQEQEHADLLAICRRLARPGQWNETSFSAWQDALPELEQQMEAIVGTLGDVDDAADALRRVIRIEGSEINFLFRDVVAATGSPFARQLQAFQSAGKRHIAYICDEIPKLEPDLAEECKKLSSFFLRT